MKINQQNNNQASIILTLQSSLEVENTKSGKRNENKRINQTSKFVNKTLFPQNKLHRKTPRSLR